MALQIRRLHVLGVVLAGVGALVALSPPVDQATVVSPATTRSRAVIDSTKTPVAGSAQLLAVVPRGVPASDAASSPRVDLFADRRSLPVPVPAPLPSMLQASSATDSGPPPLPFRVIGKKLEAGAWEVFLMQDNETLVARVGERVGTLYKIESIAPPVMTLTYLPLNAVQTLQVGDVQ